MHGENSGSLPRLNGHMPFRRGAVTGRGERGKNVLGLGSDELHTLVSDA